MLVKSRKEKVMILDHQKSICVKKNKIMLDLPEDKIVQIDEIKKDFIHDCKHLRLDDEKLLKQKDYPFLKKKELIEKIEINFGSILTHEDILNNSIEQFPLFNLKTSRNLVIADQDLQNIYIKYFIRLMYPTENIEDVLISSSDYERYFLLEVPERIYTESEDLSIIEYKEKFFTKFNGYIRPFVSKKDCEMFIQCVKNISNVDPLSGKICIEGISNPNNLEVTMISIFDTFNFGIIKKGALDEAKNYNDLSKN